jgi:hypothetical protein
MPVATNTQGHRKFDVASASYCILEPARGPADGVFRYRSKAVAGPWALMPQLALFDRIYEKNRMRLTDWKMVGKISSRVRHRPDQTVPFALFEYFIVLWLRFSVFSCDVHVVCLPVLSYWQLFNHSPYTLCFQSYVLLS